MRLSPASLGLTSPTHWKPGGPLAPRPMRWDHCTERVARESGSPGKRGPSVDGFGLLPFCFSVMPLPARTCMDALTGLPRLTGIEKLRAGRAVRRIMDSGNLGRRVAKSKPPALSRWASELVVC
jgi:hypothetical protein